MEPSRAPQACAELSLSCSELQVSNDKSLLCVSRFHVVPASTPMVAALPRGWHSPRVCRHHPIHVHPSSSPSTAPNILKQIWRRSQRCSDPPQMGQPQLSQSEGVSRLEGVQSSEHLYGLIWTCFKSSMSFLHPPCCSSMPPNGNRHCGTLCVSWDVQEFLQRAK